LQARPELTPDRVKAALTRSAFRLPGGDGGQGAGELNLARAVVAPVAGAGQNWARSTGTGSIDAARGSAQLSVGGDVLTGENSLWGPFDAATWALASSAGTAWVGGRWMGHELAGADWRGTSWAGRTWSGLYWSGQARSGLYWSGLYGYWLSGWELYWLCGI